MQFKPDKNKNSAGDNKAKGLKEPDKVKPTLKEVEERLSQLAAEVENESQSTALPSTVKSALAPDTKESQVAAVKNIHINLYLFWGMVIFTVLFANAPYINWLIMPVNQFVVTIHEMSHAVVTWLTGGAVLGMTTVPDGAGHGGLTHSLGGMALFVDQAGYLGTTFFGCLLIYLSQFSALKSPFAYFYGWRHDLGSALFYFAGTNQSGLVCPVGFESRYRSFDGTGLYIGWTQTQTGFGQFDDFVFGCTNSPKQSGAYLDTRTSCPGA
jgi:hypothetical protein